MKGFSLPTYKENRLKAYFDFIMQVKVKNTNEFAFSYCFYCFRNPNNLKIQFPLIPFSYIANKWI